MWGEVRDDALNEREELPLRLYLREVFGFPQRSPALGNRLLPPPSHRSTPNTVDGVPPVRAPTDGGEEQVSQQLAAQAGANPRGRGVNDPGPERQDVGREQ